MSSLYEQLGGQGAVDAAVDIFYKKMLADDRVKRFFDDVDMTQQIRKQRNFLSMAFGGPVKFNGKNMRRAHEHLLERGLNDSHVDIVIAHLGDTLRELGVKDELIAQVAAIAESTRDDVLSRDPKPVGG